MEPLISILIPAFNAEIWIGDTIRSALEQTWRQKEIIVVDDGSTDQTLAIARRFASDAVSVLTQPHQGAAAARNKAFSVCRGDYIQWLDADDLLAPDKIATQLATLHNCHSKRRLVSSAWGSFRYRPHKAQFTQTDLWCDLVPLEWLLRKWEQHLIMPPAAWLVSRELTEAAGRWDTRLTYDDDGEYFCRVILASDGIRFVPEARTFYRRGFESLGYLGRSNEKLESQFRSMQLQIGYLRTLQDNDRVRAACLKYLQHWLVFFYPDRPHIVRQLEQIAASLGRQLGPPRLSWKYAWIQRVFGWPAAKRTQFYYYQWKASVARSWDFALSRLAQRSPSASSGARASSP